MELINPKFNRLISVNKVQEMYIRKCIECYISQTMKKIERIIVEYIPSYNCRRICEQYPYGNDRMLGFFAIERCETETATQWLIKEGMCI